MSQRLPPPSWRVPVLKFSVGDNLRGNISGGGLKSHGFAISSWISYSRCRWLRLELCRHLINIMLIGLFPNKSRLASPPHSRVNPSLSSSPLSASVTLSLEAQNIMCARANSASYPQRDGK